MLYSKRSAFEIHIWDKFMHFGTLVLPLKPRCVKVCPVVLCQYLNMGSNIRTYLSEPRQPKKDFHRRPSAADEHSKITAPLQCLNSNV